MTEVKLYRCKFCRWIGTLPVDEAQTCMQPYARTCIDNGEPPPRETFLCLGELEPIDVEPAGVMQPLSFHDVHIEIYEGNRIFMVSVKMDALSRVLQSSSQTLVEALADVLAQVRAQIMKTVAENDTPEPELPIGPGGDDYGEAGS